MNQTRNSVLVTGGNGGLGKETIRHLLSEGVDHVVLACRSQAKGDRAAQEILERNGLAMDAITVAAGFDMLDPGAIKEAVDALPADTRLSAIFLQAGGVFFTSDFQTVEVGNKVYERTVFQNAIGGHMTLSHLRRRNLISPEARIVVAGGEGARGIKGLIDSPSFSSAEELRAYVTGSFGDRKYNPMNAIGVSKLMSALWIQRLAQEHGDTMSAIWFSPGLTAGTAGTASAGTFKNFIAQKIAFPIMRLLGKAQSPSDGGRKNADCLLGKVGENGDILGAPEGKALGTIVDQTPMNPAFSNKELRDEFWAILKEDFGT
ncbi:MAG: SDR family NAD(P)-dependent oxidoreductase [Myxococcales bacterium]|nr:SDR family NAD(P)-dependent oxidoreductase [Myxococcales bacterium]